MSNYLDKVIEGNFLDNWYELYSNNKINQFKYRIGDKVIVTGHPTEKLNGLVLTILGTRRIKPNEHTKSGCSYYWEDSWIIKDFDYIYEEHLRLRKQGEEIC